MPNSLRKPSSLERIEDLEKENSIIVSATEPVR